MGPAELQVEVVHCPAPGQVRQQQLRLPAGATVASALQASGLPDAAGLQRAGLQVGVWGRACDGSVLLRDRDRVEIYRGLQVDPKEARRLRYKKHQGQRAAAAGAPGKGR